MLEEGAGSSGSIYGLDVDAAGNVYAAGNSVGSVNSETAIGQNDLFVTKYNSDGQVIWSNQLGSSTDDYHRDAIIKGNFLYTTGYSYGAFAGHVSAGGNAAFVNKLDLDGNLIWSKFVDSNTNDNAYSVAVDDFHNVYISGTTEGSLEGNSHQGNKDVFIAKFDVNGNQRWVSQMGTAYEDQGRAIAVSNDNKRVYLSGYTKGNIDGAHAPDAATDYFMAWFNSVGQLMSVKQFGSDSSDISTALAVSNSGSVYLGAHTFGEMQIGQQAGYFDLIVHEFHQQNVDTDNDGVINDLDRDDDNDGINDSDEILIGSNPLKSDSNNDVISDGDDDFDLDGISNANESDSSLDGTTDSNNDSVVDIIDNIISGDDLSLWNERLGHFTAPDSMHKHALATSLYTMTPGSRAFFVVGEDAFIDGLVGVLKDNYAPLDRLDVPEDADFEFYARFEEGSILIGGDQAPWYIDDTVDPNQPSEITDSNTANRYAIAGDYNVDKTFTIRVGNNAETANSLGDFSLANITTNTVYNDNAESLSVFFNGDNDDSTVLPAITYTDIPLDTDSDGIANNLDNDDDNDGINDSDELLIGTNSLLTDSDGNGVNDGLGDYDNDGLTNASESNALFSIVTDSNNDGSPDIITALDSDGDGYSDSDEIANGSNPNNAGSTPAISSIWQPGFGGAPDNNHKVTATGNGILMLDKQGFIPGERIFFSNDLFTNQLFNSYENNLFNYQVGVLKDSYDENSGVAPTDNDWEFYIRVGKGTDDLSMNLLTSNSLWYWDGQVQAAPVSNNPDAFTYSTKGIAGPNSGMTSAAFAFDYHLDGTVIMRAMVNNADANLINDNDIYSVNGHTVSSFSGNKKLALYAYSRNVGDKVTFPELTKRSIPAIVSGSDIDYIRELRGNVVSAATDYLSPNSLVQLEQGIAKGQRVYFRLNDARNVRFGFLKPDYNALDDGTPYEGDNLTWSYIPDWEFYAYITWNASQFMYGIHDNNSQWYLDNEQTGSLLPAPGLGDLTQTDLDNKIMAIDFNLDGTYSMRIGILTDANRIIYTDMNVTSTESFAHLDYIYLSMQNADNFESFTFPDFTIIDLIDTDGDGILDASDTDDDNDGINDSDELLIGTNPLLADTNGDGIAYGALDFDSDGIDNETESDASLLSAPMPTMMV